MIAVSLLDTLSRDAGNGNTHASAETANLAARYVASALGDWERVLECEKEIGTKKFADPAHERAVTRSLYEVYEKWVAETGPLLVRTRQLTASGHPVKGAETLEHAFGRAQARLKLKPEMIEMAVEQVRQGHGIPLGELRDELRARLRP